MKHYLSDLSLLFQQALKRKVRMTLSLKAEIPISGMLVSRSRGTSRHLAWQYPFTKETAILCLVTRLSMLYCLSFRLLGNVLNMSFEMKLFKYFIVIMKFLHLSGFFFDMLIFQHCFSFHSRCLWSFLNVLNNFQESSSEPLSHLNQLIIVKF